MTELLFMLLLGLDSVGISAAGFTPLGDFPGSRVVGSGHFSSEYPVSATNGASAVDIPISGSAYPDAYRWTGSAGSAAQGNAGGPLSQARAVSRDNDVVTGFADADDPADNQFRWTSGVGIVGVGVQWRFR